MEEKAKVEKAGIEIKQKSTSEDKEIFKEKVELKDFTSYDYTLQAEIYYIRTGMYLGKLRTKDIKKKLVSEYWATTNMNQYNQLYYIDNELYEGKAHKYIYDSLTGDVYKVPNTRISGYVVHSLTYAKMCLDGVYNKAKLAYSMDVDTIEVNGFNSKQTVVYEPNLSGFTPSNTTLIYYKFSSGSLVSGADYYELPMQDYINLGRPRIIKVSGETATAGTEELEEGYVLYDYGNKIWANVRCNQTTSLGVTTETWWVWIPRYAYKFDAEGNYSIKFVTSFTEVPEGYTLHQAFSQNGNQHGIWMSKYNPSEKVIDARVDDNTLSPNLNDFTDTGNNKTYVIAYKLDSSKNIVSEKKISLTAYKAYVASVYGDTEDYAARKLNINSSSEIITNAEDLSQAETEGENTYYIYDYINKIWANIETINEHSGAESWWVWIPRYAYYFEENGSYHLLFINTDDKPLSNQFGSFPMHYTVHEAFNQNGTKLKGIWMSKYNPSELKIGEE